MKKNILLLLKSLILALVVFSCINDDSEYGDINSLTLVEIDIESGIINTEVNEELIFSPKISTSKDNASLEYEWLIASYSDNSFYSVGYDTTIISREPVLKHRFILPGKYALRLKVLSETGGSTGIYTLNVVTPYEEGLVVLSENEEGKSDLSFLKTLTPEDVAAGKEPEFLTHVYSRINPEFTITGAMDFDKIQSKLVILDENGKIYKLSAKNMQLLSVLNPSAQIPGADAVQVISTDHSGAGYYNKCYIRCSNGKVYGYNPNVDEVFESEGLNGFSSINAAIVQEKSPHLYPESYYFPLFVDYDESKLYAPSNHENYFTVDASDEQFVGKDIVSVLNSVQYDAYGRSGNYVTVVSAVDDTVHLHVSTPVWKFTRFMQERSYVKTGDLTLTRESKVVMNGPGYSVFYTNGNNVYEWKCLNLATNLPTTPALTIPAGKELTTINISPDMTKLYVGVYDPSASTEMKGSIYVYNTGDLSSPVESYEGVADKPISIFYKRP